MQYRSRSRNTGTCGKRTLESRKHALALDVTFRDDKNTSMSKTGAKNLQIMKKIAMSVLKIVKESYGLSMSNIKYKLSLNFEREIDKLVSLLSIESLRNALEK